MVSMPPRMARAPLSAWTELVDLGGGSYRLQCQAYMVSGAGDSFFENEFAKTHIRSGPYRSLLSKVAKELDKSP